MTNKTKTAETLRLPLETRLRLAGQFPQPIPEPEPDLRIADPKKRERKHNDAKRDVEHANKSAMSKALDAARAPWFGCNAGRAIAQAPALRIVLADKTLDVPTLWDAVQRVRSIYSRYWHAIGAPSPYARGMDLELLPEEFGTDGVEVEGGWDDRTEEEKVKDATRAMMHLEHVLGMAGQGVASEVKGVVLGDAMVRSLPRLLAGLAAVVRDA